MIMDMFFIGFIVGMIFVIVSVEATDKYEQWKWQRGRKHLSDKPINEYIKDFKNGIDSGAPWTQGNIQLNEICFGMKEIRRFDTGLINIEEEDGAKFFRIPVDNENQTIVTLEQRE